MNHKSKVLGIVAVSLTVPLFWASAPSHVMHTKVPYTPPTIQEVERFHGHLGPYVVLGAKMGDDAVSRGGMPRYFGVQVSALLPLRPPASCLLDGLQWSIGATYGKQNIRAEEGKDIEVEVHETASGRKRVYQLKPSIITLLREWEAAKIDPDEQGNQLFRMSADDLFEIE